MGWMNIICAGSSESHYHQFWNTAPKLGGLKNRKNWHCASFIRSKLFQPLVSTISGAVHGWGKGEYEALKTKQKRMIGGVAIHRLVCDVYFIYHDHLNKTLFSFSYLEDYTIMHTNRNGTTCNGMQHFCIMHDGVRKERIGSLHQRMAR
jgi:hypothetical protein